MNSRSHLFILKRIGWVLLVIRLVDIGVMVYCIANGFAYSSSLNIFAVVGGAFLIRGSLRAASIIRWLWPIYDCRVCASVSGVAAASAA